MSSVGQLRLFIVAGGAFVATLSCLPVAKGVGYFARFKSNAIDLQGDWHAASRSFSSPREQASVVGGFPRHVAGEPAASTCTPS